MHMWWDKSEEHAPVFRTGLMKAPPHRSLSAVLVNKKNKEAVRMRSFSCQTHLPKDEDKVLVAQPCRCCPLSESNSVAVAAEENSVQPEVWSSSLPGKI